MRSFPGAGRLAAAAGLSLVAACEGDPTPPALFELLTPERTGVSFVNQLPEDAEFNILNYLYYYNGGGVAVGDVDGDDLPDLFFTSNLGPDRLYRNLGEYRFEDVTDGSGITDPGGWTSGATMADVNGDGHLDIYVSTVSYLSLAGRNALFLNDGDGTFTDVTESYGLDFSGYSTQAAFFDYDRDGDLDAYLLNHSTHTERGVSSRPQREGLHPRAGDRLLRNEGGRFTDVTVESGIYAGVEGYGLGVVASDLDADGCIDLFVANDFQENDFLYRNNCDGTFTESITSSMGHTSRFSMGVDAADFNNDGRPDLVALDMLPEREDILKTSANAESFDVYELKLRAGYHPQFARNTLQLNRGLGRFSDVGYLAGVHATDWSWAPLFADLDNDGDKDLFVTNGIYRRPNDLDYINYVGNEAVQASLRAEITDDDLTLLERMPKVPLSNYAFRNEGELEFIDAAEAWGLADPGFSNGAAYADLNNSGALDLIVSNVNAPASIYRNRSSDMDGHRWLRVRLRGAGANTYGVGARVTIAHGGVRQMLEMMPTRGFQSSVDPRLHFGLGGAERVDTLRVIWPDGTGQVLSDVAADQHLTLSQDEAVAQVEPAARATDVIRFADVTAELGVDFVHDENTFFDYNREPLIPHRLSIEGPALAAGDVNGDGLDDFFVGGAKHQAGSVFIQLPDGGFSEAASVAFSADSLHEDVDAALFDANDDGHLDLYVVSGGNEFWGEHEALRDRLYLGTGDGGFERAAALLPDIFANGSSVAPGDFDGDGDVDVFVGSRVVAREYGRTPRSHLLRNDRGRFVDVTADIAPALALAGMVTDATWLDLEDDGVLELAVVGEWMPVRLFAQRGGRFTDRTDAVGLTGTSGWWNQVSAVDLTDDGREDLVLGNLGLNSYVRASKDAPAKLYVHDFSGNGALEQILTFYKDGVSYPVAGRDEILKQLPELRSRYVSYAAYGASRIEDIFPPYQLRDAVVREATTFASAAAIDDGSGAFTLRPLPVEAQFAPIYAVLADDFDGDRRTDLLVGGNFYGVTPMRGRYDASYGLLLAGDGSGRFRAIPMDESRVVIEGQVRDIARLRGPDGDGAIVIARNDASVRVLLQRK